MEKQADGVKTRELDLCDLICPLSKIKAAEAIDELNYGETVRLVLGDTDSLKSVAEETKARGLKTTFKQEDSRFILIVSK